MTIIAVASAKGGVGKTTTAVSLASGLANIHATTLIDFDPQGQVTLSFGLGVYGGVYEWLIANQPLSTCLVAGRPEKLSLLPGDSRSWAVERLHGELGPFNTLVAQLRRAASIFCRPEGDNDTLSSSGRQHIKVSMALPRMAGDRDGFVVIDTAAGGLLQQAALAVADQVIVPFKPEALGVDGVQQSLAVIKQLAPTAEITVLPVAYDQRLREHRNNVADLRGELEQWHGRDYGCEERFVIPSRIAVAEAVANGKTIWEFEAKSLDTVRVGYSFLLGRVMSLAQGNGGEQMEAIDGKGQP